VRVRPSISPQPSRPHPHLFTPMFPSLPTRITKVLSTAANPPAPLCQDPKKQDNEDDDDEEEGVLTGVAGLNVGGAAAPAPFAFTPAPKGQSPFKPADVGGAAAAPMFSFPGGAAAPANFSFNFAAPAPGQQVVSSGGGDEADEDDEDPVEEFIKSLPEPVQMCVADLNKLDEEVCELESQFRKEMRELERKVCVELITVK